ncbi:MAG: type II toxin-antitoxin system PemK/MazF family toxin [Candidatus Eremiobacteraeota bacterium]|nr:type II toxin-antitoxin system PemK/MazF family toxin [Candidatus Eremiobacteraeota bacterium]MCL5055662.1 type II toxin-antitoxin system PemK/MazF family toxin [Bacillota bacterium]
MRFPKRGEIWLVSLDPIIGSEIGKARPALVISNDRGNEFSETVTVLPITSQTDKVYPFEALIPPGLGNLLKPSKVKSNQIRTVDKKRLVKFIGTLEEKIMEDVDRSLLIHLGIHLKK